MAQALTSDYEKLQELMDTDVVAAHIFEREMLSGCGVRTWRLTSQPKALLDFVAVWELVFCKKENGVSIPAKLAHLRS